MLFKIPWVVKFCKKKKKLNLIHLAFFRLVDKRHARPLGERFQSRERKTLNLLIVLDHEMTLKGQVHLLDVPRPPWQSQLRPDLSHVLNIWAWPPSLKMVNEGVLRPPEGILLEHCSMNSLTRYRSWAE